MKLRLYGTETTVKVLRELVANWERIKTFIGSNNTIRSTGDAIVKKTNSGIVIHVGQRKKTEAESPNVSMVGKWVKLIDYDEIANKQNLYSAEVYANFGDDDYVETGVQVMNSWEWENTSSVMAGYTIVTSGAVCGDFIGIEPLPLEQWYLVEGEWNNDDDEKILIVRERNDPTIQD